MIVPDVGRKGTTVESIDYERVIADLEGRRAAFNASVDAAIHAIRAVLAAGTGIVSATEPAPRPVASNGRLTPDMLFGKSIPEAAILCLQVHKRPMTPPDIAEALESASYHHQSKRFANTVNSILNRRYGTVGDVVKIGKTWALAEWYPGRRRQQKDSRADIHQEAGEAPSE